MPSGRSDCRVREKLIAMRDASAGAFEAARRKYYTIINEVEVLSVGYVQGRAERNEVKAISEQLLEAEFDVQEAARRTQMYQEALESLPDRRNPVPKVDPIPRPRARKKSSPRQLKNPAYIELKTGLPRYAHTSLLEALPKVA